MLKVVFYQNNLIIGIRNLNPNSNPKKPTLLSKWGKIKISIIENEIL